MSLDGVHGRGIDAVGPVAALQGQQLSAGLRYVGCRAPAIAGKPHTAHHRCDGQSQPLGIGNSPEGHYRSPFRENNAVGIRVKGPATGRSSASKLGKQAAISRPRTEDPAGDHCVRPVGFECVHAEGHCIQRRRARRVDQDDLQSGANHLVDHLPDGVERLLKCRTGCIHPLLDDATGGINSGEMQGRHGILIFETVCCRADNAHYAIAVLCRFNAGRQGDAQQTLRPRESIKDGLLDSAGGNYLAVFDGASEAGG